MQSLELGRSNRCQFRESGDIRWSSKASRLCSVSSCISHCAGSVHRSYTEHAMYLYNTHRVPLIVKVLLQLDILFVS